MIQSKNTITTGAEEMDNIGVLLGSMPSRGMPEALLLLFANDVTCIITMPNPNSVELLPVH